MPIYDYKCARCGHRFDLLRSVSARDDVKCPKCGGDVVRVYEGKWSSLGKASASGVPRRERARRRSDGVRTPMTRTGSTVGSSGSWKAR